MNKWLLGTVVEWVGLLMMVAGVYYATGLAWALVLLGLSISIEGYGMYTTEET